MTSLQTTLWYYLNPGSTVHQGPHDAAGLAGLLAAGTITGDSVVWAEGQPSWMAIKDEPQLRSLLQQGVGPSHVQAAAAAAQELAGAATTGMRRAPVVAVAAAAPVTRAEASPAHAELASFEAEMAALGADPEPMVAEEGEPAGARAETPPPDERAFEDDDGTHYVWDGRLRKFVEAAAIAPEYGVDEMTFEAEEETIPVYRPPKPVRGLEDSEDEEEGEGNEDGSGEPSTSGAAANGSGKGGKGNNKKRGAEEVMERIAEKQKRAKEEAEASKQWFEMKQNTSVYVTGLPDDVTPEEMAEVFAKYGIIKPGEDGKPRLKIYRDKESGLPKGDGLVTYLKEPSVGLAVRLQDGVKFREGMGVTMSVQPAKFEQHGEAYVPKKKGGKKSKKKVETAIEKALGWGGFDDKLKPTQVTVVLKHMFTPEEFVEDPNLRADLEADIRGECAKLGPVDKIRVYGQNPEGVVQVRFRTEDAANACIRLMHGRFFGGRQVEAVLWDGTTTYNVKPKETAEEQEARLERFAAEIEAQNDAATAAESEAEEKKEGKDSGEAG